MRAIAPCVLALCVAAPTSAGSIAGQVRLTPTHGSEVSFRPYAGRASSLPAPARVARGQVVAWWHPDHTGGGADVEVPAAGAVSLDVEL